ncbi:hypothetical protein BT69DRAFT_203998 [Atractiella rhizophila]|nr:hypothetical protein BT69DRAFT_203998 [Atractiella rhizophila]
MQSLPLSATKRAKKSNSRGSSLRDQGIPHTTFSPSTTAGTTISHNVLDNSTISSVPETYHQQPLPFEPPVMAMETTPAKHVTSLTGTPHSAQSTLTCLRPYDSIEPLAEASLNLHSVVAEEATQIQPQSDNKDASH